MKYLKEIKNVNELIEMSEKLHPGTIFRGHSVSSWNLTPTMNRIIKKYNLKREIKGLEEQILDTFKKYIVTVIEDKLPEDIVDLCVLGQHYGLPTRLLDWSLNPLKALFFAAVDNLDKDGTLWIYTPSSFIDYYNYEENKYQISEVFYNQTFHITFLPHLNTNRINVQEGCFTMFPITEDCQYFKPMEEYPKGELGSVLESIIIPKDKKKSILKSLNYLGINYRTLFPDLTGLCLYLASPVFDRLE